MAFSKDFKGQVKISEVKECFDNLVDGINEQIDIYNASDYVKDIDYNMGGRDLAPLNYTLSVGGLKTFLNAYKNTVVGCKAFNIGSQYAVTDGIMFLQNGCIRIPAQTIPSLPKKLEYSPSARIYKGQKAPVVGGSGGITIDPAYLGSCLLFTADNYNYLDSSGNIKTVTTTQDTRATEIVANYFPDMTESVTVGEKIPDVASQYGGVSKLTIAAPSDANYFKYAEEKQTPNRINLVIGDDDAGLGVSSMLYIKFPLDELGAEPEIYSNAWGPQYLTMDITLRLQSGVTCGNPYLGTIYNDQVDNLAEIKMTLDYASDTYTGRVVIQPSIGNDALHCLYLQIPDIVKEGDGDKGFVIETKFNMFSSQTDSTIDVYPDIKMYDEEPTTIETFKATVKPVYPGQAKSGTIKADVVIDKAYVRCTEVVSSGSGSSSDNIEDSIDDWIYICDLNPNRDIALANAPHTAMNYVEDFYITSQSKNVPIRTIEQKDVNKNQFVSGIPADAKGSKTSYNSRYAIVKLLGEEISRTYQRRKREAKGYATFDKFFVPKGMESPFTYEGVMNGDPCGQKVFDVNVTRNS